MPLFYCYETLNMQIDKFDPFHLSYVIKSRIGDFYVFAEKEDNGVIEKANIVKDLEELFWK